MLKQSVLKLFLVICVYLAVTPFVFAALVTNPGIQITHAVTVQPIIVSDDSGINPANFFGTASQKSSIEGFIDQIWAQAGIDVNFLSANTWNNTFANWGTGGPTSTLGDGDRPTSDLSTVVNAAGQAGKTHADGNVLNMFFVRIAAGFDLLSADSAAGFAFTPGNGVTQYVGTNLLGFEGGQEAIAGVVAHEIGHNLGLPHSNNLNYPQGTEDLMWSSTQAQPRNGQRLNATQIDIATGSNLAVAAVPVPAAFWLFGSSLLIFFRMKKRQVVN